MLISLDVRVRGTVSRCEGFEGLIVVIGVVLCFEREALGDHVINFFCFCILAIEIFVICDSVLSIFVFWVGFIRFVGEDRVGREIDEHFFLLPSAVGSLRFEIVVIELILIVVHGDSYITCIQRSYFGADWSFKFIEMLFFTLFLG